MKKWIKAIGIASLVGMLLTGCSSSDSGDDMWSEIEDRGSVVVGLDDTFVPMGFRDENDELTGFDVELAKEAISNMGLEAEFQPIDWNLKETELNAGNIDLIWNGYTITDEREEKVNFTSPYLDNRQVVVVLSDSDIDVRDDLEEKSVATQNASSGLSALEAAGVLETFKGGEAVLFDVYNDAFMDLEAGRVDAVVGDEVLVRYYIDERGEEKYKVLEEDFGDEEYGIGVRKGDATLLEKLNKSLKELKENGSAAEISNKWFGENIVK